ncbi:aldehyde dehydrogenase family protein [Monashia sp. NPDC004114]
MTATVGYDPRTGEPCDEVADTPGDEVQARLSACAAASAAVAATAPTSRARWLRAVADALELPDAAAELVALADRETALGHARLTTEIARAAAQLRFYAAVAEEGSWLGVCIDRIGDGTVLSRVRQPLGPVAVFGASNFPFAFGVLGNDTASALAVGCPVVAKAHPAHPALSLRLADLAAAALETAGAPAGTFGVVSGLDAGTALVTSPHTRAVAFTGSQRGGLALWRLANEREVVVPVYAEMGTVNPVIVTPAAAESMDALAAGFVGSFTLGMGQFCTKPGLLLAPAGSGAAKAVGQALLARDGGWLLTEQIAREARTGVRDLVAAGAKVVAQTMRPGAGWAAPATVLAVSSGQLRRSSRLLEECFGPVALVAEYADATELEIVLGQLQGALAGSVMTGSADDPDTAATVAALAPRVGRVIVDEWPTGVAWTWAQHHGGPWPATTSAAHTSVGAAALDRFTRPVAYQGVPDVALPVALREANPWSLPRRVDGVMEPAP